MTEAADAPPAELAPPGPADDLPPPESPAGSRVARALRVGLPPALVFAGIVGFWYLFSYRVLAEDRRFLLPPPHEVVQEGFLASDARADILDALWVTTEVALMGLAIAFLLGSATAIAMSQAPWVERSLYPYMVFLQTVPILALVPVLGFWFGYGTVPRVVVCVIIAMFPLVINPLQGLLGADRGLHDLLTLTGASRWSRLVKLQVPAALPQVFTGLQTAAGLSVVGAVVGDFYFGRGSIGLGLLLSRYSSRLQSQELLATVFVACGLGLAVFWVFGILGRRAVGRWSPAWGARSRG